MNNKQIVIALHQVPGVGSGILHQLHRMVQGDWSQIIEEGSYYFRQLNISESLIPHLKEMLQPNKIEEIVDSYEKSGIKAVMVEEEGYPGLLREIHHPPFILYGKGNIDLMKEFHGIGIVGTRTPSAYGQMVATRLAADLAEMGWCVVSGMAAGVDTYAHRGALSVRGNTIAVLGCGIDIIYPKENKGLYQEMIDRGLILSEYPPGVQPARGLFPQRNRIISGLSRGIVVVESHQKSGSLITATWALEQGREVFAVPGSILSAKSAGPHQLIKDGAKLITCAKDILDEFSYGYKAEQMRLPVEEADASLSLEEKKILDIISYNQIHIDEILRSIHTGVGETHRILLGLEVKKQIKKLPGFYYVRV